MRWRVRTQPEPVDALVERWTGDVGTQEHGHGPQELGNSAERPRSAAGAAPVSDESEKRTLRPRSAAADHMLPCPHRESEARWSGQPHAADEARPREPDCGPTTGAPRPRTLPRGRPHPEFDPAS